MREYLCIAVLLVMILALLPGCGPSEADAAAAQAPRQLSFVVVNNSGQAIKGVGLEGANIPMGFSDIENKSRGEIKNKKLELPERLTLHWGNGRGDRSEGSVNVWSELGASYTGPVTLTITRRGKVVLTGG
ncbi:MAG: hypothetical protein KTR15_10320 [Phycisphaeraceae bacterium]|nr:hypothetical protein [Phycisphaeraceae bacterium]